MAAEHRAKRLRVSKNRDEAPFGYSGMSSLNSGGPDRDSQVNDGMSTEPEESEGVHTEATSLLESEMSMEEDVPEDVPVQQSPEETSLYPASHFPWTLGGHRKLSLLAEGFDDESIDINASTRSLLEQYLDYQDENGRRYCGSYYMPNDEYEQTRLYLQNQVFLHVLDGKPTTIELQNPTKIIDIGCGTGEWAIQIGEKFPNCEVIGTDISAIQPENAPHNVFFEIEDAELQWLQQPESVDLIHMRNMTGSFRDWRFIYEQAFDCLKPGGFLEMQDFDDTHGWKGFLGAFPPDSFIHTLVKDLAIGAAKSGRPRGTAHLDPKLLLEAGFVDLKVTDYTIPITLETGSAGKIWLISCVDGLEALCLRTLTKYMGWDPEYTKEACEKASREMAQIAKDPERAKGLHARIRVVSGRKPASEYSWAAQQFMGTNSSMAARVDTPSGDGTSATEEPTFPAPTAQRQDGEGENLSRTTTQAEQAIAPMVLSDIPASEDDAIAPAALLDLQAPIVEEQMSSMIPAEQEEDPVQDVAMGEAPETSLEPTAAMEPATTQAEEQEGAALQHGQLDDGISKTSDSRYDQVVPDLGEAHHGDARDSPPELHFIQDPQQGVALADTSAIEEVFPAELSCNQTLVDDQLSLSQVKPAETMDMTGRGHTTIAEDQTDNPLAGHIPDMARQTPAL